jgi:hypothetical protein
MSNIAVQVSERVASSGRWRASAKCAMASVVFTASPTNDNKMYFRVLKNRDGATGAVIFDSFRDFYAAISVPVNQYTFPPIKCINKSKKKCKPKILILE